MDERSWESVGTEHCYMEYVDGYPICCGHISQKGEGDWEAHLPKGPSGHFSSLSEAKHFIEETEE